MASQQPNGDGTDSSRNDVGALAEQIVQLRARAASLELQYNTLIHSICTEQEELMILDRQLSAHSTRTEASEIVATILHKQAQCVQDMTKHSASLIFNSLPTQTFDMQSGQVVFKEGARGFSLSPDRACPAVKVVFLKVYVESPVIICWLRSTTLLTYINPNAINSSPSGFTTSFPYLNYSKDCAMHWFAFAKKRNPQQLQQFTRLASRISTEASNTLKGSELERELLSFINSFSANAQNEIGQTLLHCASGSGNKNVLKLLASHSANIDQIDFSGRCPFLVAIISQNFKEALFLMKQHCYTKGYDANGLNALHYLTRCPLPGKHYKKLLQKLLEIPLDFRNPLFEVEHPLHNAIKNGNFVGVESLLLAHANPNSISRIQQTNSQPIHSLSSTSSPTLAPALSAQFLSPLLLAISLENTQIAEILLKFGANPYMTLQGKTPVTLAVSSTNPTLQALFSLFSSTPPLQLPRLPRFLVVRIVTYLPPHELFKLRGVCKDFNYLVCEVADLPSYWTFHKINKDTFMTAVSALQHCTLQIDKTWMLPWSDSPGKVSPDCYLKICIVGPPGSGKSTFISRLCLNTEGPCAIRRMLLGKKILINLYESTLQTRSSLPPVTDQFFYQAGGILLLYDITQANSFRDALQWLTEFHSHTNQSPPSTPASPSPTPRGDLAGLGIPVLVVGCKSDLPNRATSFQEAVGKCSALGYEHADISNTQSPSPAPFHHEGAIRLLSQSALQKKLLPPKPLPFATTPMASIRDHSCSIM
ncbi:hypothetical protein Pelo_879 [Pelomyxa schiedti]|nr:hypothetical protein Pelo_879 [Pelomyxa schiedti]